VNEGGRDGGKMTKEPVNAPTYKPYRAEKRKKKRNPTLLQSVALLKKGGRNGGGGGAFYAVAVALKDLGRGAVLNGEKGGRCTGRGRREASGCFATL